MNQRIQQALDGAIDRFDLSTGELDELRHAESEIDSILNAVPVDRLPDMAPAVLERIRHRARSQQPAAAAPSSTRRPHNASLREWFWTPRRVSIGVRPVYALAASLLIAVLAGPMLRSPAETAAPAPQVFTRFVLRIPNANTVALAGDFTGWQPAFAMTQSGPELWTVVVPLEPGVHTYSFVIDGERWIADPAAPSVDDGFGGVNSRVAVLTPDARKL